MNQPQRILVVEIKCIENSGLSPNQLSAIIAYQNSDNNYYLAWNYEPVKSAIEDAIPRLGSNYRHPLYFDVQVIPGDEDDALIASVKSKTSINRQRQRKRRK